MSPSTPLKKPSMPIKLPLYVSPRPRKDGTQRFYFQVPAHMRPEGWPAYVRLPDDIGQMFIEAERLYKRLKAESGGQPVDPHTKGSFPWLLQRYHQTAQYKNIAPSTKELWGYCAKEILKFSKDAGHPHVKDITRPVAFEFLELFDAMPSKKKNVYTFLKVLMGYAYDIGEIEMNPILKMNVKVPDPKVHIWTDGEIDTMIAAADKAGSESVGTAILMGADIGQRQADILKMEYERDYEAGRFLFSQNKTKEIVSFKATEKLEARLNKKSTGLLVPTKDGKKYVRRDFLKEFSEIADTADLSRCKFQKLRHTAIVRLARAGCTHSEIAAISGHTEASIATILRKYLPRDTKIADNAMIKVEISRKTVPVSD